MTTTYHFDTFGNPLSVQPTANGQPPVLAAASALLFSCEAYNPALAPYYLRATRYHPAAGRFTSLDPYAGAAAAPANLQRFVYAGQAPISAADPTEPVDQRIGG